ncbi:hypothetical protein ES708_14762 [subsurface metagenome]
MEKSRIISILLIGIVSFLTSCNEADVNSNKKEINKVNILRTSGTQLIDPEGNPIILKGTNLGNWLVPEGYMFKMGKVNSPRKIDELSSILSPV